MEILHISYWLATIFGVWYVIKNKKLVNFFILYSFLNLFVITFLYKHLQEYILGTVSTLVLFFLVIKFLKNTYNLETIVGLEGLVFKTPLFAFILRLVLLMVGSFPPFLSSNVIYYNLLDPNVNLYSIVSLILLLIFNFTLFMRITVNILFGKPTERILYKDISKKFGLIVFAIIFLNFCLGIYYILNL
ncbi:putative membrane protein [Sulfurihydrogenibium azorense Az-Fu1]|uniref:Putative membrane protein n=1 Tax=Sulfurihydrogenibium azorense (strain DSM 15241 / OCM 825 / Az-Fu1) TaxID=204536 RepID=C1DU48_SULAA|nr:hypothetical protein [Sulfurihydrogenibium azorense]ACN98709.1 putative membrane protein [Sulfurihydrogenibium azorense Az-Fu1]